MSPLTWITAFFEVKNILEQIEKRVNRLRFRRIYPGTEEWDLYKDRMALYEDSLFLYIRGATYEVRCGVNPASCHCTTHDAMSNSEWVGFSEIFASEIEYELRGYLKEVTSRRRVQRVIKRARKKADKQWRK